MKAALQPTITTAGDGPWQGETIAEHPAFGSIRVSSVNCGGVTLFGSDMKHHRFVSIEISTAVMNRRNHENHLHPQREVMKVALSEAQWAKMVASSGMYSGTPCTLMRTLPVNGPYETVPEIDMISQTQTWESEIKANAAKATADILAATAEIERLFENGGGKKDLRAAISTLQNRIGNLPRNMAFTERQMKEAMEHIIEDGKIEIESFAERTLRDAGLEAITAGAMPQLLKNI